MPHQQELDDKKNRREDYLIEATKKYAQLIEEQKVAIHNTNRVITGYIHSLDDVKP